MWMKFLKNSLAKHCLGSAVFLAALLLPLPLANACGISYLGEDYRVALLNPYVIGSEYASFFYSADYLNGYQNNRSGSDRNRNCEEWAVHLGNGVTASDVAAFLYPTSLDDVLNAIAEGADNQRFGENLFLKTILKPEKKALLDYLVFAKKYEHFSNQPALDPWANRWEMNRDGGVNEKQKLKQAALELLPSLQDTWLRRRYAYQLLLMHRYAGERGAFDKIYREYFENDRSTVLSDWALHHRAAMVADPALSSYLYAMSFDRCPEKDIASYQNFDKKLLARALAFAKNDHERAAVLALFEIKNPGRSLANIAKIYALDPANRFLPLLLVREVNKLEDWLLTDEITGMGAAKYPGDNDDSRWEWSEEQWAEFRQKNKEKDRAYLAELRNFTQKMLAGKAGSASPDLLNLLAGHLFLIEKNGVEAAKFLAAIRKNCDPKIREQQAAEELLLVLNRDDINQPETQQKMAGLLRTLEKHQDIYPKGKRDFQAMNRLVSDEFLKKGNLTAAYFMSLHALDLPDYENWDFGTTYYRLIQFLDWRAREQDIDAVLALLDKTGKSEFEKYLTGGYVPSRNALLDLRGTISFRKNNLPEAVSAFSKVEPDFWKTKYEFRNCLVSDPFVIWQDSLRRGEFPATKTAFVQRLIDLETEAKSNPAKAAENYLLLGTAWLNCTYHGKSWMMFSYGKSINENPEQWGYYGYRPRTPEMTEIYYGCSRALDYLNQAEAATQGNTELKAWAGFLKARTEWGRFNPAIDDAERWNDLQWDEHGRYLFEKRMSFYKNWVTNYRGTATWTEVTGICPELGEYFGK
jgi:hypothetical protein